MIARQRCAYSSCDSSPGLKHEPERPYLDIHHEPAVAVPIKALCRHLRPKPLTPKHTLQIERNPPRLSQARWPLDKAGSSTRSDKASVATCHSWDHAS